MATATTFSRGQLLVVELADKAHFRNGCIGVVRRCNATHVTLDLWSFIDGTPTAGVLVLRVDQIAAADVFPKADDDALDEAARIQARIHDRIKSPTPQK